MICTDFYTKQGKDDPTRKAFLAGMTTSEREALEENKASREGGRPQTWARLDNEWHLCVDLGDIKVECWADAANTVHYNLPKAAWNVIVLLERANSKPRWQAATNKVLAFFKAHPNLPIPTITAERYSLAWHWGGFDLPKRKFDQRPIDIWLQLDVNRVRTAAAREQTKRWKGVASKGKDRLIFKE